MSRRGATILSCDLCGEECETPGPIEETVEAAVEGYGWVVDVWENGETVDLCPACAEKVGQS